jgi:hypothetical protein
LCLEFSPLQVPSLQRQAWSAVTTRGRAEAVLHTAFQALLPGLDVGEARRVLAEHGCVGSKFTSGVVPKVFPPCRNHSRQRGCQRRRLAKEIRSVPDASTVQAHNRARRTHLPRILISLWLALRLTERRRAACAATAGLLETRIARHDCAQAAAGLQVRIAHHDCAAALEVCAGWQGAVVRNWG